MKHLDIYIAVSGDNFRPKAQRRVSLEAETYGDLQDIAADMAPGLAVLMRKMVAEFAAQEGAADDPAE